MKHNYPENISGQSYLEKPLKLYTLKNSGAESAIWSEFRSG